MRVVSPKEMKEIEKQAFEEYGFTERLIIENVGIRGADFIENTFLDDESFSELVFLIGIGNNGADGMAVARHLVNRGYPCRAFMVLPDEEYSDELRIQKDLAAKFGVKVTNLTHAEELESYFVQSGDNYLIVDAIFGTGIRLPVSDKVFETFNIANKYAGVMVAIDIPSGITGDVGDMSGAAIDADYTLAIGLPKTGHYTSYGSTHSGSIYTLEVGFPEKLLSGGDLALLTYEGVINIYQPRNKFAHKNTFGHCLVVGGNKGMTGALLMASNSALKVGTGLVTSATWEDNYDELVSRMIPEIMTGIVPTEKSEVESTIKDLSRYESIVVGPGMGRTSDTRRTVIDILSNFYGPVVIDADAIKMLSAKDDEILIKSRKGPTILTPHIGEFASLVGKSTQEILANPIGELKSLIDKLNCICILKGACTYIGFPTGEVFINYYPNDGMASGGSGDVLAGIVGGLAAQNAPDLNQSGIFENKGRFYQAVCLAVAAHTLAGKHAADKMGERAMTAGAIIDHLENAFFDIEGRAKKEV